MWINVDNIKDLSIGDYIRGTTFTYSQKWFCNENLNSTNEGYVAVIGEELFDTSIKLANGQYVKVCGNPGSSGVYYVQKRVMV